jgi:hypothetical protein
MAAPNLPQEQSTKQALRGVTRGGITPGAVNPPVDNAIMVNSAFTTNGIQELSVPTNNTTFQIGSVGAVASGTLTVTAITGSNPNFSITLSGAGTSGFVVGNTITISGVTTTTAYNQNYVILSGNAASGAVVYTASGVTSNTTTGTAGLTGAWVSGTGVTNYTTTLTGTSTGTQVNGLVSALTAGPLSGYTFYVNAGGANYLNATTTSIIVPSGASLAVFNSTGAGTPTITAFTPTGTEANAYPSYVGTPNATPNWVDDVTGHSYQVGYAGQLVINNNGTLSGANVVQSQIRQIFTGNGPDGGAQTQQYAGYFASYSGNLTQTGQRRTYRQQS